MKRFLPIVLGCLAFVVLPGRAADYEAGTFTFTGSMSIARSLHKATLLDDGQVLVAGGYENGVDGVLATAELYDADDENFSGTGSMLGARGRQTATLLDDGMVLIAGGYDLLAPLATAELYDPLTGTFSVTGSMNVERWRHTETLLNDGTVLIVGGADAGGALSSAEIYVVPEPSTLALAAAGLACGGWGFLRRRRAA